MRVAKVSLLSVLKRCIQGLSLCRTYISYSIKKKEKIIELRPVKDVLSLEQGRMLTLKAGVRCLCTDLQCWKRPFTYCLNSLRHVSLLLRTNIKTEFFRTWLSILCLTSRKKDTFFFLPRCPERLHRYAAWLWQCRMPDAWLHPKRPRASTGQAPGADKGDSSRAVGYITRVSLLDKPEQLHWGPWCSMRAVDSGFHLAHWTEHKLPCESCCRLFCLSWF